MWNAYDCVDVGIGEGIVRESEQQGRFPHSGIAYYQEFEKMVIWALLDHSFNSTSKSYVATISNNLGERKNGR